MASAKCRPFCPELNLFSDCLLPEADGLTRVGRYASIHRLDAEIYRWYPAKRALPAMLTHGR